MARPKEKPVPLEKTDTWSEIKHFTPRDFTCLCEGLCDHPSVISPALTAKLDKVRDLTGRPIQVISGTRCERFNRRRGGRTVSPHVPRDGVSHAADIACPDAEFRFAFLVAAIPLFNRIGLGRDFIHVDDDPDLPADVVWIADR